MISLPEFTALLTATKIALDIFDKISGQIKSILKKGPKEAEGSDDRWHYKVSAESHKITVKQDGRTIQTLTRADLASKLTPEHLSHIQTYEASLKKYYLRWQKLYTKRDDSADALVNIKTEEQLTELIKSMREDLIGIINFLQTIGVQLDDHYMEVRGLVDRV